MTRLLIVPAAGLGSRLQAAAPKALVRVAGRPMLDHLLERCRAHVQRAVVVAHPSFAGAIRAHLDATWGGAFGYDVVEQPAPTGMLDAILQAGPVVGRQRPDRVWIVWCDQVGILPETLARLAAADAGAAPPALVFPTVAQRPPYIHFARDPAGRIAGVLQRREGDAMPDVGESDMGLFSLSREACLRDLPRFSTEAAIGRGTAERNFLPFIPWLAARGGVQTIAATDPREAEGINTPEDLRAVEGWLLARAAHP
jgi:bifunctional N-acetylglucosamine-1-phosphate-uridyltransferase/glucosamine-1-phosphate-acetyltransferase GlmU-like protein